MFSRFSLIQIAFYLCAKYYRLIIGTNKMFYRTPATLNELGLELFHKSLTLLQSRRLHMKLLEGTGVHEEINKDLVEGYETTNPTCNCSFWLQYHTPCRNMLFLRVEERQDIFD